MAEPRLSLLKGFELMCGGTIVPLVLGSQRLLAFLALQDRAAHRAHVAGVLWSDVDESRACGNLRSALWRLRLPGVPLVEIVKDHLQLSPAVIVDVREAGHVARHLMNGTWSLAAEFDLRPFEGELLPGWYDDWILIERERFRQLCLHALETLCERLAGAGRFGAAVLAGVAAVTEDPLRESAHRALIKAHLAEGNPTEAIRQYRRYGDLLRSELGLEPSVHMRGLAEGLGIT